MSNVKSNYGTQLNKETSPGNDTYTVVGEVTNLDFPELMNDPIEVTHHSSGEFREFIAGSLKEVAEFTATLNYLTTASGLMYDWFNDVKRGYQIVFNNAVAVWEFNAYITKIQPVGADAQSPEATQIDVTFRPTDSLVISGAGYSLS